MQEQQDKNDAAQSSPPRHPYPYNLPAKARRRHLWLWLLLLVIIGALVSRWAVFH